MKMLIKKAGQAALTLAAALILTLFCGMPVYAADNDMTEEVEAFAEMYHISKDEVIAEGISIGGVDVGGMTLTEAVEAVEARQQQMRDSQVMLSLEGITVTYTMSDMGLSFINPSEEVVRAATLGKSGSLVERYKAVKDMANDGYAFSMVHYADRETVKNLVETFADEVNQPPIEATITKSGSTFNVTQDQTGIAVDQSAAVTQIMNAIELWDGSSPISLTVEAEITHPTYTYEMLSTISDCLGSFKTICGDLDTNRGINVMIGAAKMDGNIVLPGESYSVVDVLAPFNEANGYVGAVAYYNGGYIDSLGGGVCSLSTTLYNAVLRAELQVDKRWNHSMVVSYTDWGFDATVNDDGSRDLVFTNNYDTPIYIEAYTIYGKPDSWLYFNIYGKETRDTVNRKLVFYNNVLAVDYPTEDEYRFIEDPTLPAGSDPIWDQGSYPYVKVEAYKEIWVNGVMTERILLHTDEYEKSAPIIRRNSSTETEAVPVQPAAPAEPETEPQTEPTEPANEPAADIPPQDGEGSPAQDGGADVQPQGGENGAGTAEQPQSAENGAGDAEQSQGGENGAGVAEQPQGDIGA